MRHNLKALHCVAPIPEDGTAVKVWRQIASSHVIFVPSFTKVLQLDQKLLEGTEEQRGRTTEYKNDKNKLV
jgi:hypothetical protein